MSRTEKEDLAYECGVDESEVYNSFSNDDFITNKQIEIVKILLEIDVLNKSDFIKKLKPYDLIEILEAHSFIKFIERAYDENF